MFKFGTIGAFKQVRNNPRCKATQDLYDGQVVLPNDATGEAPSPASAEEAKGDLYVVGNIIDKPEIRNKVDFKVLKGEYVRAFRLADVHDLPVEIDHLVLGVDYESVSNGDVLVAADDGTGKWVKAGEGAEEYKINLVVLEKSTFGDKGLYCTVKAN